MLCDFSVGNKLLPGQRPSLDAGARVVAFFKPGRIRICEAAVLRLGGKQKSEWAPTEEIRMSRLGAAGKPCQRFNLLPPAHDNDRVARPNHC